MHLIISLDGNIGAGKTTLLEMIRRELPEIVIIDEPVDQWTEIKDDKGTLLEHFYQDTTRWAYTFQTGAILTRFKRMKEMISQYTTPKVMIMERSILTDKCIFAEMLHDSGEMTDMEWFLYNEFYSLFYPMYPISGILYVSTNPEISKERIKQRDRKGEETISAEYLEALDKQHQKWITHTSLPVLTISTEKEISKNIEAIKEFIIGLHYQDDQESETYLNKA